MDRTFQALETGLDDYTITDRGDVGSWVRMAAIQSLSQIFEILFSEASSLPNLEMYLPSKRYHHGVGSILKQGVERLDNVRQLAGEHFLRLLRQPLPNVLESEKWKIKDEHLFTEKLRRLV